MILIPRPWTEQPQGAAGVAWGNPLASGLFHLFDLSRFGANDLVRGAVATPAGGASLTVRRHGVGTAISSGGARVSWPHTLPQLTSLTWFAFVDLSATASNFLLGSVELEGAGYNHGLYVNSSGFPTFFVKRGGVGVSQVGTTTMAGAGPGLMVGTYAESGQTRIYWRGALEGSITHSQGTIDNSAFAIGLNRWNAASSQTGVVSLGGFYANRVLSPAEVADLSANPWQLFQSRTQRIWTPAASAGLPTLSALPPLTPGQTSATLRYSITY